jgi:hypothetical protein
MAIKPVHLSGAWYKPCDSQELSTSIEGFRLAKCFFLEVEFNCAAQTTRTEVYRTQT